MSNSNFKKSNSNFKKSGFSHITICWLTQSDQILLLSTSLSSNSIVVSIIVDSLFCWPFIIESYCFTSNVDSLLSALIVDFILSSIIVDPFLSTPTADFYCCLSTLYCRLFIVDSNYIFRITMPKEKTHINLNLYLTFICIRYLTVIKIK